MTMNAHLLQVSYGCLYLFTLCTVIASASAYSQMPSVTLLAADASKVDTVLADIFAKTKTVEAPIQAAKLRKATEDAKSSEKKDISLGKRAKTSATQEPPKKKRKNNAPSKVTLNDQSSDTDKGEVEELYAAQEAAKRIKALQKMQAQAPKTAKGSRHVVLEGGSASSDESDESDAEVASESSFTSSASDASAESVKPLPVASTSKPTSASESKTTTKSKAKPLTEEEKAERNNRTMFLGNVPIQAATDKAAKRQLLSLIETKLQTLKHAPACKIEAIRFRSLPLTSAIGSKAKQDAKAGAQSTSRTVPQDETSRRMQRSQAWAQSKRHAKDGLDDEEDDASHPNTNRKQDYLTPAQKRKVAYITGNLQPDTKAKNGCNAYVVLSAIDAAHPLVKAMNGVVFMDHTLRADSVGMSTGKITTKELSKSEGKRTVFVGGLDFEESEDGLRKWLETMLVKERGEPEEAGLAWVETVRIVRDADSGLGKGFAYASFKDSDCVDELLAMDASKLKLSKKKIRFERYKSAARMQAGKKLDKPSGKPIASQSAGARASQVVKKPSKMSKVAAAKLGEELASLSKNERKSVKSANIDRVTRRLEKKKAKSAALKRESRMEQVKKRKGDSVLKLVGRKLAKKDGMKNKKKTS